MEQAADNATSGRVLMPVEAAWQRRNAPEFMGGNQVRLLQGGDELFPAMHEAIAQSRGGRLATCNVADFEGCGLHILDPWHL